MIFIDQYYCAIGAVEADSREEALALFQRKYLERGGQLDPQALNEIETLDEFVERARNYWR